MERIIREEAILVGDLGSTARGTKGFGSSYMELTKQVGTSSSLLIKSAIQGKSSLRESTLGAPHGSPRPRKTSLQARTGPDLFTKQSREVIGPLGQHNQNNKPQGKIYMSEITNKNFARPKGREKPRGL